MTTTYPVVTADDFPNGLRCGECSALLEPGDRYAELAEGVISGLPVVKLICVPCDQVPALLDKGVAVSEMTAERADSLGLWTAWMSEHMAAPEGSPS